MKSGPRLILNKGVRHRILDGHPWVFSSEVEKVEDAAVDGGTVEIISARGQFLGSAIYNSRSQIVARRYSRERVALDASLLARRIDQALAHRHELGLDSRPARRLVWSEADRLPGVIVDRYADILVLQTLTLAMAKQEETLAQLLVEKTGCKVVLARNDAPVRQLEGLPLERRLLRGELNGPVAVTIAGIRFELDLWSGQKTGFYLDQVENYAAVAAHAPGRRVLDCFTNQGAFALAAMRAGATSCRGVDQSGEALRLAAATAQAEKMTIEWTQDNVFDHLRDCGERHEKFDLIVLDPPSFTKGRANRDSALRGYHDLHVRALRLLTPGGIMASFSCSHHVTAGDWADLLERAAKDSGATLRRRQTLGQSSDHPVLVQVPETEYLHGYVVEKVDET